MDTIKEMTLDYMQRRTIEVVEVSRMSHRGFVWNPDRSLAFQTDLFTSEQYARTEAEAWKAQRISEMERGVAPATKFSGREF